MADANLPHIIMPSKSRSKGFLKSCIFAQIEDIRLWASNPLSLNSLKARWVTEKCNYRPPDLS